MTPLVLYLLPVTFKIDRHLSSGRVTESETNRCYVCLLYENLKYYKTTKTENTYRSTKSGISITIYDNQKPIVVTGFRVPKSLTEEWSQPARIPMPDNRRLAIVNRNKAYRCKMRVLKIYVLLIIIIIKVLLIFRSLRDTASQLSSLFLF